MSNLKTDVLIIGAGPAGLYAAYYAGYRGMSVAVMDSLDEVGGQISAMYPEKLIFDTSLDVMIFTPSFLTASTVVA